MADAILQACGGLGLFLLGMLLMTEGLRTLAGERLRGFIARFTRTPISGVLTGATTTAVVQSSSATTVATVGFVGAGLMTFPQALGVIFGANIGTTLKNWLLVLIAFKLDIGSTMMPLLFFGALGRLVNSGRAGFIGQSLAGFALVFISIDLLQTALGGLEGVLTPQSFPPDTLIGRLLLVGIGFAITLVTQSSSAGVATAITAVSTGTITLPQAAAMVIGMDVGTTVTALLATIGGSPAAKRTGYAHVVYNCLTACMAFLLLTPFFALIDWLSPAAASGDPELMLVVFHTGFNALGVAAVLPFTRVFAAVIYRLVPERETELTRRLDRALLAEPGAALDAVVATIIDLADATIALFADVLDRPTATGADRTQQLQQAVRETRTFDARLGEGTLSSMQQARVQVTLHALDHVSRLLRRCGEPGRAAMIADRDELAAIASPLRALLRAGGTEVKDAKQVWRGLERDDARYRQRILAAASEGRISVSQSLDHLDAYRWLRRAAHHVWRLAKYREQLQPAPVSDAAAGSS